MATENSSSRLEIAGLSGRASTSPARSVTAERTLRRMASGGSSSSIRPATDALDFDILAVGTWRSMTRPPTLGM